ncbi:SRPBCC family protein [Phaeocystidibacter luteus]|uniref:SRPBCC family protein n=1 Tax=Phaeocystidibacter luteus TaxID=911197 RepID=A0A6N6RKU7_9FLAO|nr:SRPBCC family protein [Phaeocystidibacter luteus]KAB2813919.1 SRPBCC family protein [Phaeocystidibacter luteus]
MPTITLHTKINAPVEVVFDLARSVDAHRDSMSHTDETVIAGVTSGLMELDDTVTWRAKHLGRYRELTSKITELKFPQFFVDEMVEGDFKSFRHEHRFVQIDSGTIMTDIFEYSSPYGFIGKAADALFLRAYMKSLLSKRNAALKAAAELSHS